MTIYGTPYGTPNNATGFQGTQPGNAAQATLPGIPPNMSVLAAVSAGILPLNALATNFGQKHNATQGRDIADCIIDVDQNGAGTAYVANGGSQNSVINGGNSFGAGGANQTPVGAAGEGEGSICPANAPGSVPTLGSPVQYQG